MVEFLGETESITGLGLGTGESGIISPDLFIASWSPELLVVKKVMEV